MIITTINYKLLILCVLISVLLIIFPSPYFNAIYDVEADYFANIMSVYLNGYPVDYLHPGTTITYLSAFFIKLFNFASQESLVLLLRFVFLFLNLLIICFSMATLNKSKNEHIFLFLAILFLHPTGHYTLDLISPNIFLISLTTLAAILGINLNNKSSRYAYLYGAILAIGVATKFSFIIVLMPLVICSLLGLIGFKDTGLKSSKLLIVILSFIITLTILIFPLVPMMPLYISLWPELITNFKLFVSGIGEIGPIFVSFLLFGLLIYFLIIFKNITNRKINLKYESVYIYSSFLIIAFVCLDLIIKFASGLSYIDVAIAQPTRYLFNFLGFFAIVLSPRFSKLTFFNANGKFIYFLIIVLIFKLITNHTEYKNASNIANNFSLNMSQIILKDENIVFYPSSTFTSLEYFLLWSDYRYGDRTESFFDQKNKLPFPIDNKYENIHILNSRSFDLSEDLSNKFSYKYLNFLLSSDYVPRIQKGPISQQLYLLEKKDRCTDPYDGFSQGDSFHLIIPLGLRYISDNNQKIKFYSKNFQTTSLNDVQNIASDLASYWINNCDFKVNQSINNFANLKSISLIVKTKIDG